MKLAPLIRGIATYIPGFYSTFKKKKIGNRDNPEYYYGLWLKHVTMLGAHGMKTMPESVAEIGPGNSLGVGIAALLSGSSKYLALDVVAYSDVEENLNVFDQLLYLFKNRVARPSKSWPDYDMYLDENLFPSDILTDEVLEKSLSEQRVHAIRNAIKNVGSECDGISIQYYVPWDSPDVVLDETVDLILSHSVLEHVNDLRLTYESCYRWMRPKGYMSHQIDFRSHGTAVEWNGHWSYSDIIWKIIYGRRPYLINRQPRSVHMNLIEDIDFDVICDLSKHTSHGITRTQLASSWEHISDGDLSCPGIFVQAQKPE